MSRSPLVALLLSCFVCLWKVDGAAPPLPKVYLDRLRAPAGFKISLFSTDVPYVRSLTRDVRQQGHVIYAGSWDKSNSANTSVYVLLDRNSDGYAEYVRNATIPLYSPNGVALLKETLYVASVNTLYGFEYASLRVLSNNHNMTPDYTVALQPESPALPTSPWHGLRYLAADEEKQQLYMGVGAPCNVPGDTDPNCANTSTASSNNQLYATIQRLSLDKQRNTATMERIAEGIRNTVGLLYLADRNELWWTDNGRDKWSDDQPPDELNRISSLNTTNAGNAKHFGFPFCYGVNLADPQFLSSGDCSPYEGAFQALHPHAGALGLTFYPARASRFANDSSVFFANATSRFPDLYSDSFFIAQHGSAQSKLHGYSIARVSINASTGQPTEAEDFIKGWLDEVPKECTSKDDCLGNAQCINSTGGTGPFYCGGWGRPVDVLTLTDGSLLISDDLNGVIYRVYYDDSPGPTPWFKQPGWIAVMSVCSVLFLYACRVVYKVRKIVRSDDLAEREGPVAGEMVQNVGRRGNLNQVHPSARNVDRYARLAGAR